MRTIEKTLYLFDELSDAAKENARNWWREASSGDDWSAEGVIDDAAAVCAFFGWDVCQTRKTRMNGSHYYAPTVFYSGFWSQGDGACFEGDWRADRFDAAGLRAYASTDEALHRIAADLAPVVAAYPNATASVKHRGRYYHEHCTEFDVETNASEYDDDEERTRDEWREIDGRAAAAGEAIQEAARDLMRWIYRALEREYEWQNADEQVDENLRVNGYEFDEEGRIV